MRKMRSNATVDQLIKNLEAILAEHRRRVNIKIELTRKISAIPAGAEQEKYERLQAELEQKEAETDEYRLKTLAALTVLQDFTQSNPA